MTKSPGPRPHVCRCRISKLFLVDTSRCAVLLKARKRVAMWQLVEGNLPFGDVTPCSLIDTQTFRSKLLFASSR